MKKIFLLLLIALLPLTVCADDSGTCGDNLTWSYVVKTGTLTISGNGEMTNFDISQRPWKGLIIKNVIIGDSVTSIGSYAFPSCSSLDSVKIGSGVKTIGGYAFKDCISLRSIIIPDNVISIGNSTFEGCNRLLSIAIGNNVKSIGQCAFKDCILLISISFPNGMTKIENGICYRCSFLTSVSIPSSVTTIGAGAFEQCSRLPSIYIPKSVTTIGEYVFLDCLSLASIVVEEGNTNYDSRENCNAIIETASNKLLTGCMKTKIPNSVTSIETYAFSGCRDLTSIMIPKSVTSIGNRAFQNCSRLDTIVVEEGNAKYDSREDCNAIIETESNTLYVGGLNTTIPQSVTTIGNYAFRGRWLREFTIPNHVTSIGNSTFRECIGLTTITFGSGVTSIGSESFAGCANLNTIISLNPTPPVLSRYAFDNSTYNATLKVPVGSKSAYTEAEYWKKFTNIDEIEPAGVQIVSSDKVRPSYIYDLNGRRLDVPKKGLKIIDKKKVLVR